MTRLLNYYLILIFCNLFNVLFIIGSFFLGIKNTPKLKEEIIKITNIKLKIYKPLNCLSSHPAIIYIHGGAWMMGGILAYDNVLRYLCYKTNMTLISINYQKLPKQFPTQLNDCLNGYKWILDNAKKHEIDRDKLVLAGDSAGGNLILAILQKFKINKIKQPHVIILIYPLIEITEKALNIIKKAKDNRIINIAGYLYLKFIKKAYLKYPKLQNSRFVSIKNFDDFELPKTLVIQASIDPLNRQINGFCDTLIKNGFNIKTKKYQYTMHGFINLNALMPNAKCALNYIASFIKQNLK